MAPAPAATPAPASTAAPAAAGGVVAKPEAATTVEDYHKQHQEELRVKEAQAQAETAAAAKRTLEAAAAIKRDSVQCNHCLSRLPTADIVAHIASCELRTVKCPRGCGAYVRFLKMELHLAHSCPKK